MIHQFGINKKITYNCFYIKKVYQRLKYQFNKGLNNYIFIKIVTIEKPHPYKKRHVKLGEQFNSQLNISAIIRQHQETIKNLGPKSTMEFFLLNVSDDSQGKIGGQRVHTNIFCVTVIEKLQTDKARQIIHSSSREVTVL